MLPEELTKEFNMVESGLEQSVFSNHFRDLVLLFEVGEMNLIGQQTLAENQQIVLVCKDIIRLSFSRDASLAFFDHPLDSVDEAQEGPKTVISFSIEQVNLSKSKAASEPKLLPIADVLVYELWVETMDPLIEVTCRDIEITLR